MNESTPLTTELREFVASSKWTFAKTYADTWPHEYIVRDRVDEQLFVNLVNHINTYGYQGKFYRMTITYFDEADKVYWTMGGPLDETKIINRCGKEQTYEYRLARNSLPEQKKKEPSKGPDVIR